MDADSHLEYWERRMLQEAERYNEIRSGRPMKCPRFVVHNGVKMYLAPVTYAASKYKKPNGQEAFCLKAEEIPDDLQVYVDDMIGEGNHIEDTSTPGSEDEWNVRCPDISPTGSRGRILRKKLRH